LGFQWFRQFESVGFPDDLLEVRKLALAQRAPKPKLAETPELLVSRARSSG